MMKKTVGGTSYPAYSLSMFEKIIFAVFFVACMGNVSARAADGLASASKAGNTSLPVPRFVTLATDEVNVRTGPGLRYPIKVVIKKDGLPVEIIREFDVWRQIRDAEGDEGWVHKGMLSGKRAVIVNGSVRTLAAGTKEGDRPVAKLEPGVIAALKTCRENWCSVSIAGYSGWVRREWLWGVYPEEQFGK